MRSRRLLFSGGDAYLILGSSMAEHPVVNRRVASSSLARGATFSQVPKPPWDKFGTNRQPVEVFTVLRQPEAAGPNSPPILFAVLRRSRLGSVASAECSRVRASVG